MSGFTKGPWKADDFLCDGDHALRIGMPDRNGVPTATIAVCQHNWNDCGQYDRRISWAEAQANARLIASAPDMLETLQQLEYWFNTDAEILDAMTEAERADHIRQHEKIRKAIAKALGEQA